jgi:arylsulfatase
MGKDVFLLTVDALGASHVGSLGYDRETTPRLDALADRGIECRTCIAQSSHTRESMPSLFYSAYPFQLGEVGPVPDDRPTVVTELSDAGYATAGFHSNPYLSRAYDFDRGFEAFDDALPLAENRLMTFLHRVVNHFRLQPYTRGEDLTRQGLSWIDNTTADSRFLWLHYMDPHGPYQPPARFQRLFRDETVGRRRAKRLWRRTVDEPETITDDERETLVDLYDAEIRYVDEAVGTFVDGLADRGLLDSSLVVLAADHGDAFGEHGVYGHPRQLYEDLVHVPLILAGPDLPSTRLDRPVENTDIAPTLVEAVGRDPAPAFRGTPVQRRIETTTADTAVSTHDATEVDTAAVAFTEAHGEGEEADISRFAVRTRQYKYQLELRGPDELLRDALYDLAEDPDEQTDIRDDRPAVRERLRAVLDDHVASVTADGSATERDDPVDHVVADRLEDLGYR